MMWLSGNLTKEYVKAVVKRLYQAVGGEVGLIVQFTCPCEYCSFKTVQFTSPCGYCSFKTVGFTCPCGYCSFKTVH